MLFDSLKTNFNKRAFLRQDIRKNTFLYTNLDEKPIFENWIYFESRNGRAFAGNLLRIAVELTSQHYGDFKMFAYARKENLPQITTLLKRYGLDNIQIICDTTQAVSVMLQCKYIVSDSSLKYKYVKRNGQVVINTWHGTPLKHMGKSVSFERHTIGSSQQFFLSSDYLLAPSKYFCDIMLRDYMIEDIMLGTIIFGGYPRNTIFFDKLAGEIVKEELGFAQNELIAYMPTWRGEMNEQSYALTLEETNHILANIDLYLSENQILLFKPHPFLASNINYSLFKHIQPFPEQYETYEVLNSVDCLITDYSSVLFDFAITRKKIILFNYDLETYNEKRGLYLNYADLPFPQVQTIKDLVNELPAKKTYDETSFLAQYCPYDNEDATKHLCEHIFLQKKRCAEYRPHNDKPNVLLHGGSLVKNGITTAFINLAKALIKRNDANYYISFSTGSTNENPGLLSCLPEGANYLPLTVNMQLTQREHRLFNSFRSSRKGASLSQELKDAFHREWQRQYSGVVFDTVINFDSYTDENIVFFGESPSTKKMFFIHNDMEKEIKEKKEVNRNPLYYACNSYNSVALVSEALEAGIKRIAKRSDNLYVVHNLQDTSYVRKRAKDVFSPDANTTIITGCQGGIDSLLDVNQDGPLIVTIGRFSPEKRHDRLLAAFKRFWADYPNARLVIIGGYGDEYEATLQKARALPCFSNIAIIRSLLNPFPVLARGDLFVLASSHEGLPVTIAEADILGVPIIATDLESIRPFMKSHNGYLVPENTEGVLQGMIDYMAGKVHPMNIDWEQYNAAALDEFFTALNEGDTCKK